MWTIRELVSTLNGEREINSDYQLEFMFCFNW